jgi:hexulose-6-phosphate isomerase
MIAVMQGRLVPPEGDAIQCFPRRRWRDEFSLAAEAGVDAIEWIYDRHGADVNPLATDTGIEEMAALSRSTGTAVVSVCADYFLDFALLGASPSRYEELVERLIWLVERCRAAGARRVVLPFVDAARIATATDRERALDILARVVPVCETVGIELHLETSLDPESYASLLAHVPSRWVRVTYDSGNSASLGYNVAAEFAAYGDRIGSVHLKDRVLNGGTVPLGAGDADLNSLFRLLHLRRFDGDLVLQVARGAPGAEVAWTRQNLQTVAALLKAGS